MAASRAKTYKTKKQVAVRVISGVFCHFVYVSVCPRCKRKTTRAIALKLGTYIVHGSR